MEPPLSKPMPKKRTLMPTKRMVFKQPPKIRYIFWKKRKRETKTTTLK